MSVRWRVESKQTYPMHPCPCCGYKTLPERGHYDLCPVCWWEDDGDIEPWQISGPNGQTLLEAQQQYLSETRPYRRRPGKVRPPRRREARDSGWQPYDPTDELMARVQRTYEERRRDWEVEHRRVAQEIEDDPEGPFKEYNAAMRSLRAEAPAITHREVMTRMRELGREHSFTPPDSYLEMQSRLMKDPDFYRGHPVHAAWWLVRYARPGTLQRRWRELRTGTFGFVG